MCDMALRLPYYFYLLMQSVLVVTFKFGGCTIRQYRKHQLLYPQGHISCLRKIRVSINVYLQQPRAVMALKRPHVFAHLLNVCSSSSSLYYRYLIYIKAKLRKYLQEIPSRLFTTDKIVNECFFSDWCISDLFSMNPDSCVIMNDFYDFEWRLWQVQVFFVSENGQSVSRIICFNVL